MGLIYKFNYEREEITEYSRPVQMELLTTRGRIPRGPFQRGIWALHKSSLM